MLVNVIVTLEIVDGGRLDEAAGGDVDTPLLDCPGLELEGVGVPTAELTELDSDGAMPKDDTIVGGVEGKLVGSAEEEPEDGFADIDEMIGVITGVLVDKVLN